VIDPVLDVSSRQPARGWHRWLVIATLPYGLTNHPLASIAPAHERVTYARPFVTRRGALHFEESLCQRYPGARVQVTGILELESI
jgi:hypothetical protein